MKALLPKKAQLDKIAGTIIRSQGFCLACGDWQSLTWAHIITRSVTHMRWDLDNAICLCMDCHVFYTDHPTDFIDFIIYILGYKKYEELVKRSRVIQKPDYGKIMYTLQKEVKRLGVKV